MSTGRRAAVLGVAVAALAAIPLSVVMGAWLGGAIPFQTTFAATLASLGATAMFWLVSLRTALALAAVAAWRRDAG